MARSPKPDRKLADAAIRDAFQQIEKQPAPEGLLRHIDVLVSGKKGRRTQ